MIDTDKYERMDLEGLTKQDLIEILKGADPCALLAETKRLREVIDKEHPTFDWASRQTIANLEAEVKRLREQVKDLDHMVEHWKWELQTRMCPIEFDALVNGDDEE